MPRLDQSELLLFVAAGAALWWYVSRNAMAAPGAGRAVVASRWNGWTYYSDGVVTGPDGSYYKNGNFVWSPRPTDLSDTAYL